MRECRQRLRDLGMLICAIERSRFGALTPRVGAAPEDDSAVLVGWVAQNFMQLNSEAVEVTNVQWAEVTMEGIVQESLVDTEVDRRMRLGPCGSRSYLRAR
jgi:hypothetical protein